MKLMLILAPVLVGIVAAIVTVVVIGMLLPREHKASASAVYSKSPTEVWGLISEFDRLPEWRSDCTGVERLPSRDGHTVYKERGGFGDGITMEVTESQPPGAGAGGSASGGKMVTRIIDEALPFGGTWTFEVVPEGTGTRLRLTEDGHVKPALFRFVSRVIGHDATMKKYLSAAGKKFGERVVIQP